MAALALAGCRTAHNYSSAAGPRYAGLPDAGLGTRGSDSVPPRVLKVVTFNVQFALQIDRAVTVLRSTPALRDADVVLLQEMDAPGTARIAASLGMFYVYYPATLHPLSGRDFGEAILSRWPIMDDAKIILPHPSRFQHTQRIAVGATILAGGVPVRVYSTHLGTISDVSWASRRDQLTAILADAEHYPRVILGGDFNNHGVGRFAVERGFLWPTEHGPRTTTLGRFDHIFVKGLALPGAAFSGTENNGGASDHRPVWAVARL